jgi:predicted nuclease of predicted toxin-antitoxin system
LRFLVDAQLPPALARQIETLGHSADHVFDCGLATASDDAIRAYAATIGAVIVTKDEDFVVRRVLQQGPAVVWALMMRIASPSPDLLTVSVRRIRSANTIMASSNETPCFRRLETALLVSHSNTNE